MHNQKHKWTTNIQENKPEYKITTMSKSMCFHVYDKTTTLSIPQPAKKVCIKKIKMQKETTT